MSSPDHTQERCGGTRALPQGAHEGTTRYACPGCPDCRERPDSGEGEPLRWEAEAPVPCPHCGCRKCGPWHNKDGTPSGEWWCPECRDWFPEPDNPRIDAVSAEDFDALAARLREAEARAEAAEQRAADAEERLAQLEGPHVLVLSEDRWTVEHSLACRESGRMAECEVHERIAEWIDRVGEPQLAKGRYEVGDGPLPAALARLGRESTNG